MEKMADYYSTRPSATTTPIKSDSDRRSCLSPPRIPYGLSAKSTHIIVGQSTGVHWSTQSSGLMPLFNIKCYGFPTKEICGASF